MDNREHCADNNDVIKTVTKRNHWPPDQKKRWVERKKVWGYTAEQIAIEDAKLFAKNKIAKPASAKTIQRHLNEVLGPSDWHWSQSPENAALILPVLSQIAVRTWNVVSLSESEANWIGRIRRARPDIQVESSIERAWMVLLLALDYASRERTGASTEDLDTFMVWAPWQSGTEALGVKRTRYETLVDRKDIPAARWRDYLTDSDEHDELELPRRKARERRVAMGLPARRNTGPVPEESNERT